MYPLSFLAIAVQFNFASTFFFQRKPNIYKRHGFFWAHLSRIFCFPSTYCKYRISGKIKMLFVCWIWLFSFSYPALFVSPHRRCNLRSEWKMAAQDEQILAAEAWSNWLQTERQEDDQHMGFNWVNSQPS